MDKDLSRTLSLFPLESCPQIPDEAFNLFHSIDRELYTRLIHNLGRDPAESVQVMAFWMWLEREGNDMNLIRRMLSLPPALLNELAEEAAACLKCVEKDEFHFGDGSGYEITLLPEILSSRVVSLRFFHENRIAVLRGVTKIINSVCSRAFNDILQRLWRGGNAAAAADSGGGGHVSQAGGVPVQFMRSTHEVGESSRAAERRLEGGGGVAAPPVMPILYHPYLNVPFVPLPPAASSGLVRIPPPPPQPHVLPPGAHRPPPPPVPADAIGIPIHMVVAGSFPAYDMGQMLSNELGEMLSRNLSISSRDETNNYGREEEEGEISADDRTIFLTFSKGYPITEDEVREFFTRRFGDFIEELIMQEVGEDEQVLYARMVARSAAVMEGITGGNKAKYSINGKHVWARKYVKKQQQQQSRSPPSPRQDSSQQQGSGSSPSTSTSGRGEHYF
ncbi:hypothetical protein Salat_0768100 [Sesamum alatum]|uniref:Uncharacterized protein n=1 Tax=Sesamum alatum TaxID=300844 RepID=A0AAE1YTP5_9LAMI|nr:hypothetical protein Salat_0768100 [Sesamum alatum]